MRHREAVPTLLQLLGEDLWLQLAAIDALGQIGDPKAIAPLAALVPDSIVAEPAVTALQRIAAPESLEILLGKLLIVSETSLRDLFLLTLGVIIDLHPDPAPIAARFSGTFAGSAELSAYLDEALR